MKTRNILGLVVATLLRVTMTSIQAQATIVEVPAARGTVSIAMTYVVPGDTILVSNATGNPSVAYTDTFTVKSGVKVIAKSGETPIVDGGSWRSYAADFAAGASSSTILSGITIKGGTTASLRVRGSGVVRNCVIENLSAGTNDDGVHSDGSTTIEDCIVRVGGSTSHTGIIHLGGPPAITGCTIEVTDGNGISILTPSIGTAGEVSDCSITLDTGNGMYLQDGSYTVSNITVAFDQSDYDNIGIAAAGVITSYYSISDCLITVPAGVGVFLYADSVNVERVTVDNCGSGFVGYGGGSYTVSHCIASDYNTSTEYGFWNVNAVYCIADGTRPYDTGSQGTGSINEEPLYCSEGSGDYTLRIDSYGNPGNNASDYLIGAFPVACAYDTLRRDTELVAYTQVTVWQDVIVPDSKRLTLMPGTKLLFDGNDESGRGIGVPAENELTVEDGGELMVIGNATYPVEFRSSITPPIAWLGVTLREGSVDTIQYAKFRNGIVGVFAYEGGSFLIEHCDFDSIESATIKVQADSLVSGVIRLNTIRGLLEANAPNLEISENALNGRGIGPCIDVGTNYADVEIRENTVENCDLSAGIWVDNGSVRLTENTMSGNKWGLHVEGDGYVLVGDSTDSDSDNIFTDNTRGMSCNWSEGSSAGALVRNNQFVENNIGFFVAKFSYGGYADVGSSTDGKNSFVDNDSLCIRNASDSPLAAIGNWFGSYPFDVCWTGSVVADDPLQVEPAGALVNVSRVMPRLGVQGIWPNPSRAEATIEIAVGFDAEAEVQVFDVAGRLVRSMRADGGGELRRVKWDGRDRDGISVGSGMYFVRVKANGRPVGTSRLLVTR